MIYLGIGSNLSSSLGNRFKNIELAIEYLSKKNIKIINRSSFYESLSYPDNSNPKFINIVVSIKSELLPNELMSLLISIEEKLERKRNKKNDPRTCDIDIIDYEGKIINLEFDKYNITVPHKSLSQRNFVLYPLKEICPNWIHPKTKKNIDVLIKNLKTNNNEITKLSKMV